MTRRRSAVRVCPCLPFDSRFDGFAHGRPLSSVEALSEPRVAGESKADESPHSSPLFDVRDLRHAARRLEPSRARRRHAWRRGGSDLSAPGEGGARGGRRRPAGRPVVPARRRTRASAIVTADSPEALALYRHSTAHLLAAAVTQPVSRRAVRHRPGDRRRLLLRLRRRAAVRAGGSRGDREEDEGAGGAGSALRAADVAARRGAASSSPTRGEPLKVQLIEEKTAGQSEVSCYTIKDRDTFVDFCVGPHVPSTGRLKAFKLLSTSNAYWKGDAHNQPMQRVYGTAFFSDAELKAHLQRHRGSEEARPPQARQGARPVHVPPVGAGRGVLAGQGHDALQHARQLHARACSSRPATSRSRRRSSSTRRCGRRPGTGSTIARTCSSSSPKASRWA